MTNEQLLFWISFACIIFVSSIAVYLAKRVDKLQREIDDLKAPPF